jgi:hypothetical protein
MFYLLIWGIFVFPCSGWVDFVYPKAPKLTFNYIDTIYITWTSDISQSADPLLSIWCETKPPSKLLILHTELSESLSNKRKSGP